MKDRGARRVGATRAVHATAGMRTRRREVEPAYRRFGTAQPRRGPEHQLLKQLARAATDRTADEIRVACLEIEQELDDFRARRGRRLRPGRERMPGGFVGNGVGGMRPCMSATRRLAYGHAASAACIVFAAFMSLFSVSSMTGYTMYA